mmetsp:Transcript_36093/g.45940  ORF Transcript_36093/g.45940 Transcript_36093/m.45940 type:complete len:192 (+) Transcript_36093:140-715(+)
MGSCCAKLVKIFKNGDKDGIEMLYSQTNFVEQIQIDTYGKDVHTAGNIVSGNGTAIAATKVEQDAAYWEVKVVEAGPFSVGLVKNFDPLSLNCQLFDIKDAVGIQSSSKKLQFEPEDIIGVALDQNDIPMLKFYKNGEVLNAFAVKTIQGVYMPAVSVELGAKVEVIFDESRWQNECPRSCLPLIKSADMI